MLATICFALGAALTGSWFLYQKNLAGSNDGLPETTRSLLAHMDAPVKIRFYSVLPASGDNAELKSFSGRTEQLLAAVAAAGGSKIEVIKLDAAGDTNSAAAAAEGLKAFNLDQGDACFLGLSISSGARKEVIARLQPEWESALPYDLVRAILRVAAAPVPAPVAREVAKPSSEMISSIQRLIPDVSAVSAEDASQLFHAEFLKDCAQAGKEMEAQMEVAQQKVMQAQGSGSPEAQVAAQKKLQEVQLALGEKLKQVAADLQTRLAVYQQMKNRANNPPK
jgi:hypothetical protein